MFVCLLGEIAFKLVELAKVPIAAPSANLSGMPSGTKIEDILEDFAHQVDFIINGGESTIGIESTIVKVIDGVPHILRPGAITKEQIKKIAGCVIDETTTYKEKNLPSATLQHYQLKTKSVIIYSKKNETMITKIQELAKKYSSPIILCSEENKRKYQQKQVFSYGSKNNLEEISKNLFHLLRKLDTLSSDMLIIEGLEQKELASAIMNRLLNVCQYEYFEY